MPRFAEMTACIRDIPRTVRAGTLVRIGEGRLHAEGVSRDAQLGDLYVFDNGTRAEVTEICADEIRLAPFGADHTLSIGARLWPAPSGALAPADTWLGRVINAFGDAIDGSPLEHRAKVSTMGSPMGILSRRPLGQRIDTGEPAIDTMLPLVRGQRVGLFAGSGVGKTSLLNSLAGGIDADVVVFAMIGERGHELATFVNSTMPPATRARSICVAATADCCALERRRAALSAIEIAEHFRDQGRHVLVLMDSLTRWAEAYRQVDAMLTSKPIASGFPPNTAQDLARMLERLGPGYREQGDITAVLSVLVAGSDMDEPLADMVRGMVDGHIVLDRDIAERGRFPAIDVLKSVSRSLPSAASDAENAIISKVRSVLTHAARIAPLRDAGLTTPGNDLEADSVLQIADLIDAVWSARDLPDAQGAFGRLAAIMDRT